MSDPHKNLAISSVATAPSPAASGTSLIVASGDGTRFPTPPFNATIWPASSRPDPANAEIVRVTNISTDTLTITRAQEGTSARTVVVGDLIAATVTAKTLTDLEQRPQAQVSKNATQSVADNTSVKVAFNVTDWDRYYVGGTAHFDDANDRLIAREKGLYYCWTFISWGGSATGYRELFFKKNGSVTIGLVRQAASLGTYAVWQHASGCVELDVGDYIEVFGLHTAGAGMSLAASARLGFTKVSDIP